MKLGVCVPYRDRELHLNEFIPKVGKYLKDRNIDFQMYFCHQVDDKLFNRGATKNIAAKHALEEGCDYIVWHDIDMIPLEDGGADYSFPDKAPRHIATKIEQMDWKLKYHEYFGGAVLFSKEHLEKTNGYSNDYWDWGMEDDDLFWRCHKEGLTDDSYLDVELENKSYIRFNGNSSSVEIPVPDEFKNFNRKSHTVSVLTRAFQMPEKNPIFLIGSKSRRYVEYPIFRIPGYDYGISFNNSRALSCTFWNTFNQHNYMWLKRYDNQWSWVTVVFDDYNKLSHFYLNGTEVDSLAGFGSPSPFKYEGRLKKYNVDRIYLGTTPSEKADSPIKYFKGDIAAVKIWDRDLTPTEVKNLHKTEPKDGLIYNLDIEDVDSYESKDIIIKSEDLKVPNSILPFREDGKMRCLPHKDEGIVGGKFVKGDTTAKNEERYVLQMQQGKIDYKNDGISTLKYELVGEEILTPWAKMINIKL